MANELLLVFSKEKIQELMNYEPDKIVARTIIEQGRLDSGETVGVVRVFADAIRGGEVLGSIDGCPVPPCTVD